MLFPVKAPPDDHDSMVGASPDDDQVSLPDSVDHGAGDVAEDPDRQDANSSSGLAVDPDRERLVLFALAGAIPCAIGPTVLDPAWIGPDGSTLLDVGPATRPEYCISVVDQGPLPAPVLQARQNLADISGDTRAAASGALQVRAREALRSYAAFQARRDVADNYLWKHT